MLTEAPFAESALKMLPFISDWHVAKNGKCADSRRGDNQIRTHNAKFRVASLHHFTFTRAPALLLITNAPVKYTFSTDYLHTPLEQHPHLYPDSSTHTRTHPNPQQCRLCHTNSTKWLEFEFPGIASIEKACDDSAFEFSQEDSPQLRQWLKRRYYSQEDNDFAACQHPFVCLVFESLGCVENKSMDFFSLTYRQAL